MYIEGTRKLANVQEYSMDTIVKNNLTFRGNPQIHFQTRFEISSITITAVQFRKHDDSWRMKFQNISCASREMSTSIFGYFRK